MENIIRLIAKYLILLSVTVYTIKCFSYFTAKDQDSRRRNLNFQIFLIFSIHLLCNVCLYLNTKDGETWFYYLVEIGITLLYVILFPLCYRRASRLIINNIAFLMLLGYVILSGIDKSAARKQFILASAALFITAFIPVIISKISNVLRNGYKVYAIVGILFLATVFVPGLGISEYGSRNWISIAGFTLQPMEFVKIIFIFFVASSLQQKEKENLKDILVNAFIAAIFMLILAAEKDFGAVAIFYICYISVLYLDQHNPLYLIAGVLLAAGGIFVMYTLFKDSLFSHIMTRVEAWRNPWAHYDTGGYQVIQSLFALSTGGWLGSGLGNGRPSTIPVVESDFIFSAICEELGVVFGLCLILIYLSSFIALINIASKCRDLFYKYVTFGCAVCYITQVILNIGGVTKFIPSTGVTLPLVSYGINSIFSTLILFSVVQYTYIQVNREIVGRSRTKKKIRKMMNEEGR